MRFWSFLLALTWALTLPTLSTAQNKPKKPKQKKPAERRTKWDDMDIGPFQAYGVETKLNGKLWRPALKGLNIKLGPNASVCFDTERLRMAASWTGGFLKLPTGRDGLEGVPKIVGALAFHTRMTPGWAGPKGEWIEPTPPVLKGNDVYSMGPLPREWAKWRGHYTHGDRVVLSYSVGASSVLVSVAFVTVEPTPGSTDTSPLNDSARFACSRNSRGAMSCGWTLPGSTMAMWTSSPSTVTVV